MDQDLCRLKSLSWCRIVLISNFRALILGGGQPYSAMIVLQVVLTSLVALF